MNFVTLKDVQAAADKGWQAALECSKLHWHQLSHCTAKELREFLAEEFGSDDMVFYTNSYYCALCELAQRKTDSLSPWPCSLCPKRSCKAGNWKSADIAFMVWLAREGTLKSFQTAAKCVWQDLCAIDLPGDLPQIVL